MKKGLLTLSMALGITLFAGCNSQKATKDDLSIIPLPVEMTAGTGEFKLNGDTKILTSSDNEEVLGVAGYLSELLSPATGFAFTTELATEAAKNTIFLKLNPEISGETGAYHLTVSDDQVIIEAPESIGLFYGVQSLRQLLPAEIESSTVQNGISWNVPAAEIKDEPQFQYRGLHLDVGRHFFPVSFIKKYIDLLAMHKMNKFHWHLTEDQGWRLEIKKYPKLQEIASQREGTLIGHGGETPFEYDNKPYGGYYTQEEAREVVAYAAERFITVIPEIEMPGHATAALAAYPELGCTGGPYEVIKRWGVFPDIYCAGEEKTFEFLENVLLEVMDIFPSEYIHIGGDEAPKDRWEECPKCQARIRREGLKNEHELQSYFITRMEKFLNKHGRQIIGWDEILEGGLAPGATVMSWRGEAGGIEAAKMGHDVIMTPNSHLYLDYYQTDPENEPLGIGGYLPLEKVYSYHPVPEALTDEEAKHILGAQGNLWTEYVKTADHVEYMVYPRAVALSEVVWTPKEQRDYSNFLSRLEKHYKRLDILDVNYFYEVPKPSSNTAKAGFLESTQIALSTPLKNTEIRYTLDGSEPTAESALYTKPVTVDKTGVLKAITVKTSTGEISKTLEIPVTKVAYTAPIENITPGENGLTYSYYEGFFRTVKQMEEQQPENTGIVTSKWIPEVVNSASFGFTFSGLLPVEKNGLYHFHLSSDDGSKMYLNEQEFIDNDGLHSNQTVIEPAALKKGLYKVKIYFTEGGGGYNLNLKRQSPDGSVKELTPADFFTEK
ncbi:family 20 glycosylhydrolase [Marinilabilia salmonicolor]|uniref:beta-N-acetylhexosaminidase n=1 Tax=Marinilabilia salmonicolor TaxID=989 RepID=A0A368UXH6_9BACT|nr:family 20 glycosylhydrolase [Marinilabilia salmonicolor]RCW31591.1 hexosaminidase [Marinilabilia salmonicolor]